MSITGRLLGSWTCIETLRVFHFLPRENNTLGRQHDANSTDFADKWKGNPVA